MFNHGVERMSANRFWHIQEVYAYSPRPCLPVFDLIDSCGEVGRYLHCRLGQPAMESIMMIFERVEGADIGIHGPFLTYILCSYRAMLTQGDIVR